MVKKYDNFLHVTLLRKFTLKEGSTIIDFDRILIGIHKLFLKIPFPFSIKLVSF